MLYAEDEASSRIVFEHAFGSELNLITVSDGPSALALMETRETAVLVADMRMPGLSGEDLLRITKERHPRTVRIAVTAYSELDRILRVLNEGLVARYIIKPWDRADLLEVLRWACETWSESADSAALQFRLLETVATASSFAHDLKTPLMSILANADYLRELADDIPVLRTALEKLTLAPEHQRTLSAILDELKPISEDLLVSTQHMRRLIDGMRDWPPATPVIDPLPMVRHAMAVCQPLAKQLSASIDYQGPGALPRVRMSASELGQVLINVVANSAHAIGARGATGHVSITAQEAHGMLELQVRDNGIGVTRREDGKGIGVGQCERILAIAGGRLHIANEPGIGTVVTITLPTAA